MFKLTTQKWILEHPEAVVFHYVPKAVTPDEVRVYVKSDLDTPIFTYYWIDGEQALCESTLGRVHLLFQDSRQEG